MDFQNHAPLVSHPETNKALACRFCSVKIGPPARTSAGSAARVCHCRQESDYMGHLSCFYTFMLENDAPPQCTTCQSRWLIPPSQYLPFYIHRKKMRLVNAQILALRVLLAFFFVLITSLTCAYLVKGLFYIVRGNVTYVPFGSARLTVHWEPGVGDLVVGSLCSTALLLLATLVKFIQARCCCCGRKNPYKRRSTSFGGGYIDPDFDMADSIPMRRPRPLHKTPSAGVDLEASASDDSFHDSPYVGDVLLTAESSSSEQY